MNEFTKTKYLKTKVYLHIYTDSKYSCNANKLFIIFYNLSINL